MSQAELRADPEIGNKIEVLISLLYHCLLHPGAYAIDGGANSGAHAIPMARLVRPGGKVIAYEPQPEIIEQLRQWAKLENLSAVIDSRTRALGSTTGRVPFFVNPNNNAMSSLDAAFARESHRTILVDLAMLDAEVSVDTVCFIKLDLEGGEFPALRGARAILTNSRPAVVFEFGRDFSAQQFSFTREEFFSFFEMVGYNLWDIFGERMTRENWLVNSAGWEWIAVHDQDPRAHLIRFVVKRFWETVSERPALSSWKEVIEFLQNPFRYFDPFS